MFTPAHSALALRAFLGYNKSWSAELEQYAKYLFNETLLRALQTREMLEIARDSYEPSLVTWSFQVTPNSHWGRWKFKALSRCAI
jgi:hypothetical protein